MINAKIIKFLKSQHPLSLQIHHRNPRAAKLYVFVGIMCHAVHGAEVFADYLPQGPSAGAV